MITTLKTHVGAFTGAHSYLNEEFTLGLPMIGITIHAGGPVIDIEGTVEIERSPSGTVEIERSPSGTVEVLRTISGTVEIE